MALPRFIPPMLASFGAPFDDPGYLFELKWDGFRTLVFRDESSFRLMSRNGLDVTAHYPEFGFLMELPPGIVLDGELVAWDKNRPAFEAMAERAHRYSGEESLFYVAFDLLYRAFDSVMDRPLVERKEMLRELVPPSVDPRFIPAEHVDTHGRVFFEKARERNLEGIIAKHKESLYYPGKRVNEWKKIKRKTLLTCVIIGFIPQKPGDPAAGFKSLLVAADVGGQLAYVGRPGTGFGGRAKSELYEVLREMTTPSPCVPCPEPGVWVRPELFCNVEYAELTSAGVMRAPVFKGLVKP